MTDPSAVPAEAPPTMRAARFHAAGDIRLEAVAVPPEPGPGEVLLRVEAAGVCGSDALEHRAGPVLAHGRPEPHPVTGHAGPVTLGHELAGRVVAVGPGVEAPAVGALVACGAGMSCGVCAPCRAGRTNLCERYATLGFQADGGLAELCLAPAAICRDAGEHGLDAATAALAQPMAIAVHARARGGVAPDEAAVVVGVGGIGAFLTYALARADVDVVVSDPDPRRRALALALGAGRAVAPDELLDAVAAGTSRPRVVFEVSGSPAGLEQAFALVPRGGRIVAVGVQKADPAVPMRRVALDELELVGTVAHVCAEDLPEALALLAAREGGWRDVAPDVLPLDALLDEGILPLVRGDAQRVKAVFDPRR